MPSLETVDETLRRELVRDLHWNTRESRSGDVTIELILLRERQSYTLYHTFSREELDQPYFSASLVSCLNLMQNYVLESFENFSRTRELSPSRVTTP